MKRIPVYPFFLWAARDILRDPLEPLLSGLAMALLVSLASAVLLLTHALSETTAALLQEAPALVLQKTGPWGWMPLPSQASQKIALSVPGVVHVKARIWGMAMLILPDQKNLTGKTITVAGINGESLAGKAILGPGLDILEGKGVFTLAAQKEMTFQVADALSPETAMACHNLVLLDMEDARELLGLPPGTASDLAIELFHEKEAQAILLDLSQAFPFTVRIATREAARGLFADQSFRRGGIVTLMIAPALLALVLIVTGAAREGFGKCHETGLMKALGWTTGDIIRVRMCRALLTGVPAVVLGMALSYALVFWPGITWPGRLLLGWRENPPALWLKPSGALLVLAEVAALVLAPFLAAHLWPALKSATAGAQDLLHAKDHP